MTYTTDSLPPFGFREVPRLDIEKAVAAILRDVDTMEAITYKLEHPQTIAAIMHRLFVKRKIGQ